LHILSLVLTLKVVVGERSIILKKYLNFFLIIKLKSFLLKQFLLFQINLLLALIILLCMIFLLEKELSFSFVRLENIILGFLLMSAFKYNFFIWKLLTLQSFWLIIIKLLIMVLTKIARCCHFSFYLIYIEIQIQVRLFVVVQRIMLHYIKVLFFCIFILIIFMTVWIFNINILKFIFFILIFKHKICILLIQKLLLKLILLQILFIQVNLIDFRLKIWPATVDCILLNIIEPLMIELCKICNNSLSLCFNIWTNWLTFPIYCEGICDIWSTWSVQYHCGS